MEEWRDIQGYEGLYQVSSCGRVKSLNYNKTGQERILKQRTGKGGYKVATLCNGKIKTHYIHRLVANAFLENSNNYPEVNHKDEQKYNNYVENLEFCTAKYNANYGTRKERHSKAMTGKYTGVNNPRARKVQCINTGEIFETVKEAAKYGNTYSSDIAKQIQDRLNTAGKHPVTKEKLQWKYVD